MKEIVLVAFGDKQLAVQNSRRLAQRASVSESTKVTKRSFSKEKKPDQQRKSLCYWLRVRAAARIKN